MSRAWTLGSVLTGRGSRAGLSAVGCSAAVLLAAACGTESPADPVGTSGGISGAGAPQVGGAGAPAAGAPSAGSAAGSTLTGGTAGAAAAPAAGAEPQGPTQGGAPAMGGSTSLPPTDGGSEPAMGGTPPTEPTEGGAGDSVAGSGGEPEMGGAAPEPEPSAAGSGPEPTEPQKHVFLLLGQSNMAGYAKAQAADKQEDPRVTVLGFDDCADTGRTADAWATATPPLHECWNGAVGPGDWFAKTLIEELPEQDTLALVPCALSGKAVETFMKGMPDTQYDWIVARARAAQEEGGVIEGMLFHQGESNCGDNGWPAKVATLVQDLRADLNLEAVPFLAGELPYGGNCSQHNPLVRQLPDLIDNAYVVSAEGLGVDPADTEWNLHFGHDETVTLGQRYAQALSEALGW